jgi:hypothetical protein
MVVSICWYNQQNPENFEATMTVLVWIRISFKLSMRIRIQEAKPMRILI